MSQRNYSVCSVLCFCVITDTFVVSVIQMQMLCYFSVGLVANKSRQSADELRVRRVVYAFVH